MTELSLEAVDLREIENHNSLLQSSFWGELKAEFGWKAFAFELSDSEAGAEAIEGFSTILVLLRELGFGQSLAYVPHGPMAGLESFALDGPENNLAAYWRFTACLAFSLKKHLPSSCMFIRFDPPWGLSLPALTKEPAGYPDAQLNPGAAFTKARMDIQPPSTVILDLNKSEEELLKGMKSKTRYNIKLAAKKGVEVRTAGAEALPDWYELYRITAERDKIALHSYEYYERVFALSAEKSKAAPGKGPELRLLQAEIDGVVEAGIITCWQGESGRDRRATYLYGASSNNKRNYMPAYALQWEAIKQAAAAGCKSYDFFGIPPVDNPDHPMYGLYRFKTGFGGEILHRPGCWDYPLKKTTYKAFSMLEKARNFYYKTLRKR